MWQYLSNTKHTKITKNLQANYIGSWGSNPVVDITWLGGIYLQLSILGKDITIHRGQGSAGSHHFYRLSRCPSEELLCSHPGVADFTAVEMQVENCAREFGLIRFLPIKCSTERLQQSFSRQDAKTAKNNIFLFLRTWRPLPRGVRPWGSYSACGEINTPRGESSFLRLPKPKFNGKFQICLVSCNQKSFWSFPAILT